MTPPTTTESPRAPSPPLVGLDRLDELWFQVGGTRCNLACHHCFISCHPGNDRFGFLGLDRIAPFLAEAEAMGVKEFYFTGGEPFLNKELLSILDATLAIGPATVLTNGTVFTERTLERLAEIEARSRYSLELRVSIDGYDAATNDPIRGDGTFAAAMAGVRGLVKHGFLPIITMTQTWPERETIEVLRRFRGVLQDAGYDRPRIKILPTIHLGEEEKRTRAYAPDEVVTEEMLDGFDKDHLLCHHSRIVTDRGVAVCPILIEKPDAHLAPTLAEAARPFALGHNACFTCYLYGTICSNAGSSLGGSDR